MQIATTEKNVEVLAKSLAEEQLKLKKLQELNVDFSQTQLDFTSL